jgi:signal transduction histidine kinase
MDIRIAPETLVPRLGELLIERGLIEPEDLKIALDFQRERISSGTPCLIGQALIELDYIDQYTIDEVVTIQIFQLQNSLEKTNRELEQRVAERTADLQNALSKLTELNQLKSNFISNISHELRTPLTHIKGYLDILSDQNLGPLTKSQINAIEVIQRSEDRLEQLIDDLIRFSFAVRGELDLSLSPINIPQILEDNLPSIKKKAASKDISLAINIPVDLPEVLADEEKIPWVFNQLLDNAIKFTPAGGRVKLAAAPKGDVVDFSVTDSGIGIPKERLPEVFEPFHQLDGSVTRRYSGTGLGLALVSRILEAHGSKIKVDSIPNKGTYIKFSLSVAK